jgi:hypothetical protein
MLYGRHGTGMDRDHLNVHINDAVDVDTTVNTQEQVEYSWYSIDSYITFFDDGENEATFSINEVDDLIEALNIIKQHHADIEGKR